MGERPNPASIAAAGLLLMATVALDLLPMDITLAGYFGLPVFIIAASGGPPSTVGFGTLAVGITIASGTWDHRFGTHQHIAAILLVLAEVGVAAYVSYARCRREMEMTRVRAVADVAQRALLPHVPPMLGEVGFATRYVSAAREALVGGDLYEVVATPRTVRVIIGDVKGKGLPAVRLTTVVLGAFREAAVTWLDVEQVASACTRAVAREADAEDFVTALMIDIHADGHLTVLSAGHPPAMLVSANGSRALSIDAPSPPLGIAESFRSTTMTWDPGDRLLLYTDGLVEARDRRGGFFPLEEHLSALTLGSLDAALDRLTASVQAHVGGEMHDDLALLMAQRLHVPDPAGPDGEASPRRMPADASVRAAGLIPAPPGL
jgi:sigma-B regulation protein RsbU (phosphoserine phosphatase)